MKHTKTNLLKGKTKQNRSTTLYKAIAAGLFFATFIAVLPLIRAQASGTISGAVYIDYNMNGAMDTSGTAPNYSIDTGVQNVTVTAYAINGASKSATTDASGAYSIDTSAAPALPSGPYRLEYTSLPSGFNPSSVGTNNASAVQFVNNGNSTGNDLGIIKDIIYSENDPLLATSCYINGNPLGGGSAGTAEALVSFPYSNTDNVTTNKNVIASTLQIGATWGLAWQSKQRRLFTAATIKRHVGLGSLGAAGIYVTAYTGSSSATTTFVNLANAPYNLDVGTIGSNVVRGLPSGKNTPNHDIDAFAKAGKVGIGDIDISEDGNTLWGVNIKESAPSIFKLDVSNASPGSFTNYPLSVMGGVPTCTSGTFHPWAIAFEDGVGYLGGVCSAQASQNVNHLQGFVLTFDPANPNSGLTTAVTIPLNYAKGEVYFSASTPAPTNTDRWYPWVDTYSNAAYNGVVNTADEDHVGRPTPILSDIEFDGNGAMMIGLLDRAANQVGYYNYKPDASNTVDYITDFSGGDLLKACSNGIGGWNLESNGTCGGVNGSGLGNTEGPNGGEFFGDDKYTISATDGHNEVTWGGLAHVRGTTGVIVTSFDPTNNVSAGGIIYHGIGDGVRERGYEIFGTGWNTNGGVFGKTNGLGDIEVMRNPAPLQVGNRVWTDTDRDGVQDPGESPIDGVELELWADTDNSGFVDTLVGTATTDANGNYLFGGINNSNMLVNNSVLPNTAYEVRIPVINFVIGEPLFGYSPTVANNDGSTNGDSRDSDGVLAVGNVIATFTTGNNAQNNHSYDFGFNLSPTAADASVQGKVKTAYGRAISRTFVTILNLSTLEQQTARTNHFGYFKFNDLQAGDDYVISARHRSYEFPNNDFIFTLQDNVTGITFVGGLPKKTKREVKSLNQFLMKGLFNRK